MLKPKVAQGVEHVVLGGAPRWGHRRLDEQVAALARELRTYGERERYESVRSGWNSRLDELQAALLLTKLPRLEAWNARRREIGSSRGEAILDHPLCERLRYHGPCVTHPERRSDRPCNVIRVL